MIFAHTHSAEKLRCSSRAATRPRRLMGHEQTNTKIEFFVTYIYENDHGIFKYMNA